MSSGYGDVDISFAPCQGFDTWFLEQEAKFNSPIINRASRDPSQTVSCFTFEREAESDASQSQNALRVSILSKKIVNPSIYRIRNPSQDSPIPMEHKVTSDVNSNKPNALVVWPSLYAKLQGKKTRQLAIFLDYDGTLTPIVDTPSKAVLASSMRKVIEALSFKYATAIVTGRKIETICKFVNLNSLYYAGSHGFDIRGVRNAKIKQVAANYRPFLQSCYQDLCERMKAFQGTLVEDNDFSISVHYRKADPDHVPAIEKIVDEQLVKYPKLVKKYGKKVFEVRPQIDWDKGKAVKWLLNSMFQNEKKKKKKKRKEKNKEIIPIYLGDDVSDEDAFRELQSYDHSVSIHVKGTTDLPTAATYVLNDTSEVETFLFKLTQL